MQEIIRSSSEYTLPQFGRSDESKQYFWMSITAIMFHGEKKPYKL